MTATVTDLDADRRHFADFLATKVLHYVKHRMCAWPFEGEDVKDMYYWARANHNNDHRMLDAAGILRHITGVKITKLKHSGIGVPALADTGIAGLGVIDIDTHTTGTVVDLAALAAVCDPAALVTRSTGGRGSHIYFFPPVPVNSHVLRLALDRYIAYLMGSGAIPADGTQIDVFPKGHGSTGTDPAERITPGGSVRFPFAAGRRIGYGKNMPDGWVPPCEHPGKLYWGAGWVTDVKEIQRIIILAQAEHLSWLATWGGPPCLGTIIREGIDEGERNTLIYNAAYFAMFATHDEELTTRWVWDKIISCMSGSTIEAREANRTMRSGIERALDATKPQYVCDTSICNKNEARCLRLGQPTASGYTAGTAASDAATAEQSRATVAIVSDAGPNALSDREGVLYIGDTAVTTEYCPIDEKYYYTIDGRTNKFTPAGVLMSSTLGVLTSLLQREVLIPKGAQRGWLTRMLLISRRVATVFPHPAYGQLKSALYMITKTENDSIPAAVIHDAMQQRGHILTIDAAIRNYPGRDWAPIISPENEVLGMRLVLVDHDFLIVPPPPVAPAPEKPDATDY